MKACDGDAKDAEEKRLLKQKNGDDEENPPSERGRRPVLRWHTVRWPSLFQFVTEQMWRLAIGAHRLWQVTAAQPHWTDAPVQPARPTGPVFLPALALPLRFFFQQIVQFQ